MRYLVIATILSGSAVARADGDATQSIDSPLAPGSGVTITASQSKTALTAGVQQHFAKEFDWNAALEGVVNDTDTLTVFSRSAGGGPGTTLRLGVGYSGARAKPREGVALCNSLRREYEAWQKLGAAESAFERCQKNVDDLRKQLSLAAYKFPMPKGNEFETACAEAAGALSDDIKKNIDALNAATQSVPEQLARAKEAVEALLKRRSETQNKVDVSGIEIGMFGKPKAKIEDATKTSCEDIAIELRGYSASDLESLSPTRRQQYDRLYGIAAQFENSATGGTWLRAGLSGYASVVGGKFHPAMADGTTDYSKRESWATVLPGVSFDLALMMPDKIIATSVGITAGIDDNPVKVCHRVTQGDYYTEECNNDYLKRPDRRAKAYGSLLLSLNPLLHVGEFGVGAQLSLFVATATGKVEGVDRDIFEHGSWRYKWSLPVFLTTDEAPWGLAAGLAPEISRAFDSKAEEEIRVLFFVGARPQAAARK